MAIAASTGAPRPLGAGAIGAGLLAGIVALAALRLWQDVDYWSYSEGVYALTSRLWLDGADLYGSMVGAQPPGLFILGAGILSLHDSIEFLRLAIGILQLGGGLIAAVVAWRLSGSRVAAIAAPPLLLLTPWAVHEHGSLTPELPAVPLLLGAALLAARSSTAAAGGVLAAVAVGFKLPFLLPAIGIVVCSSDRRRAGLAAVVTLAVMILAGLALFGSGLVRDVITAQLHSGGRGLGVLMGVYAQAAWNLAGLLVPALALVTLARGQVRDPALGRAWLGLTVGLLATVLTTAKVGTSLNVLVPVEAALVPPALAGAALVASRTRLRALAVAALAFTVVQTVALVGFPARTLMPFIYPASERGAWGRVLSAEQVRARAAAARDCPPGVAFPGPPFLAFVGHRPPAGGQPDEFLTTQSPTLRRELAAIQADVARCPQP